MDREWEKGIGGKVAFWLYSSSGGSAIRPCQECNDHSWGCFQWAEANGIEYLSKQYRPAQTIPSAHAPASIKEIDSLWCDKYGDSEGLTGNPSSIPDEPGPVDSKDLEDIYKAIAADDQTNWDSE